jgi:hypothetical protein
VQGSGYNACTGKYCIICPGAKKKKKKKFFPSIRGGPCVLSYVTRGGGRICTSNNTFIGRNAYTTAKQGAKATLVYLLSDC